MDYCIEAFRTDPNSDNSKLIMTNTPCIQDCSHPIENKIICGLKIDGERFRVRLFENRCQLSKFNCDNQVNFTETDSHICNGVELPKSTDISEESLVLNNLTESVDNPAVDEPEMTELDMKPEPVKNIIVVRSPLININRINETIENFFAGTHVFDLPVKEVERGFLNETTRRRLIRVAGPIKVFVPWVKIPKNISDDFDHTPTLSTCYHKCPRKCPDTYAPVCGVPGIVAREPSLMFQNHCFMDVAQCKMFWENKSPTALSSSYVESSFLFCLGDEMNGMYRFLPLIRTLQHMGRLRKKGRFHYRFKNMKFFNNLLARQPKFMG